MRYFVPKLGSAISRTAATLAFGVMLAGSVPTQAQDAAGGAAVSPTQTQIDAGRQIWTKAGCSGCHGSNGQGGAGGEQPAGPGLQAIQPDREGLVEVIGCGRPGTEMPAWLKGAYAQHACYGQDLGPAPQGTVVIGIFDTQDIDALVDYLLAEIVGK